MTSEGTTRVRTVASTRVEMTHIIQPTYTNVLGTAFGGQILSWIDTAAAVVAMRHCGGPAVTARIDGVSFTEPICSGEVVTVRAWMGYTGRASMEVDVIVFAETIGMKRREAVSARLTFVAVDGKGKPTPVPKLLVSNEDERRRFEEGEERAAQRRVQR